MRSSVRWLALSAIVIPLACSARGSFGPLDGGSHPDVVNTVDHTAPEDSSVTNDLPSAPDIPTIDDTLIVHSDTPSTPDVTPPPHLW